MRPDDPIAVALSEAIALESVVAAEDQATSAATRTRLAAFPSLIERRFPRVAETLESTRLDEFACFWRWRGGNAALAPILLTAHYDVVPATEPGWTIEPFGGRIDGRGIHGRGAIDDKASMIAMLAAVERLIEQGYHPLRDVYLAFGGDEETGGRRGAARLAAWFRDHGIHFACLLDEGSVIVEDMLAGLDEPVALIGCGEKGHVNVELHVRSGGGHAAAPPRDQAGRLLARALHRVLRRPFPKRHSPLTTGFVRHLGVHLGGVAGWLMRLYPLSAPIVDIILARSAETDAMLRTTVSLTMLRGAAAENQLPTDAVATLNLRLLPGTTVAQCVEMLERRIRDSRVEVRLSDREDNHEAPPTTTPDTPWFRALAAAVAEGWGPTAVVPYLITATTDSQHYRDCTDHTYRFVPMKLGPAELATIHGPNEWISHENLARMVAVYAAFIRDTSQTEERAR